MSAREYFARTQTLLIACPGWRGGRQAVTGDLEDR